MTTIKQRQNLREKYYKRTDGDLVPPVAAPYLPSRDPAGSASAVERLRWQLGRAEGWIVSADGKATIILGLNGALIAGVLAVDPGVVTEFLGGGWLTVSFALVFVAAVIYSCCEAAMAVLPNLGKPKSGGSIWHFEDVNALTLEEFRAAARGLNQELEVEGLEQQLHTVSKIVATKFHRLRRSVFSLLAGVLTGATILFIHDLLLGMKG